MSLPELPEDPPITITVDGHPGLLGEPSASWWLPLLGCANWVTIGLSARSLFLEQRLADPGDDFDLPHLAELARVATLKATGMEWPRAVRLSATMGANWADFEAWAITHAHGLDPLTAPPRRTLAAALAMLRSGCEKERDLEKLHRQLDDPRGVPGITTHRDGKRVAPWKPEAEAADFLATAAAFGTPVPASALGGDL